MTPDLLRAAGEVLYGDQFQSALARDLDVSDRTMRRWLAGDFRIPPTVRAELVDLLKARGLELAAVRRELVARA